MIKTIYKDPSSKLRLLRTCMAGIMSTKCKLKS